jgi:DNA-binding transcriptional ArsR family regulator
MSVTRGKKLFDKVRPYAKKMHAVGHPHRLSMLYLLSFGPMESTSIALSLGLTETLVSHHLSTLHMNGWVVRTRSGRNIIYRLNDQAFFRFKELFTDTPFEKELKKA